jgi:hypothetical protein
LWVLFLLHRKTKKVGEVIEV